MKNIFTLIFLAISINVCLGQSSTKCDTNFLQNDSNLKKADPCVLTAANYILSRSLTNIDQEYSDDLAFLLIWMSKTPDFTFSINNKMLELCEKKSNTLLFSVYLACLSKEAVKLRTNFVPAAIKLFVDYVKDTNNGVKQTSKIKKLIEDYKNNKIDQYTN